MAEIREEGVALGQAMSPKKKITRSRSMGFKIKPRGELGSGPWSAASRPCRILLGVEWLELSGTRLLRPMKTEADSSFVQITGNRILSLSLALSLFLQVSGYFSEAFTWTYPTCVVGLVSWAFILYTPYNTFSFNENYLGKIVEKK